MSAANDVRTDERNKSIYGEHVLDVWIVEVQQDDGRQSRFRFEAPKHERRVCDDPEQAELD
jgi:hypothetical protein